MAERQTSVFRNYRPSSPVRDHTDNTQIIEQGKLDPKIEERIKKAERGELKAKLAAILDRGIVHDRLAVELPPHLHGEWAKNDPIEIRRLEALGFTVDVEYATSRAIHSDGSNSAIVGDVIHMICPREIKETIDEIRQEQVIRQHTKKNVKGKQLNKEEVELYNNVYNEKSRDVSAFTESSEKQITQDDISSILESMNEQTSP